MARCLPFERLKFVSRPTIPTVQMLCAQGLTPALAFAFMPKKSPFTPSEGQLLWWGMPLSLKLAGAVEVLSFAVGRVAGSLISSASHQTPESALVLLGQATAVNDLARDLNYTALFFLIVSALTDRREKRERRMGARMLPTPQALQAMSVVTGSLAAELERHEQELEQYDAIEALQNSGNQRLLDNIRTASRTTWVATCVGTVASILFAWYLYVR